jgi:predicted Rossmann-fold nucleotide-binding protein
MFKLMEHADMFIIFKGGSGTISEWGTAWVLAKLYYSHHKPFILFGRHWINIVDAVRRGMNIDSKEMSVFEICVSKEEVVSTVKKFEKKLEGIK